MIAGVCGGIGAYANIDPTVVRLAAVLLFFLTGPGVVVAYLVMALVIPEESTQITQ
jgi:phage shock protein PspC (stress-responsive transcriptional regulator)